MRAFLIAMLLATAAFAAPPSQRAPRRDIENVATFARLYGVVRYFYPSDAAATLDWDRFAVHGVRTVRAARGRKELQAALEALFGPLGPGIEIGVRLPDHTGSATADSSLLAWRYLGPGVSAASGYSPYKRKRTNRSVEGVLDGFVTLMQTASAPSLRGKTLRLRGQVRSIPRDASGSAALWLRVDRPSGVTGFFDNMSDRPIRLPEWREYAVEGTVAEDATNVGFGVMASGAVMADFDAIDLAVRSDEGQWTSVPIEDAGFEARADATGQWIRAGTSTNVEISRPVGEAPEGRQFLRFAPSRASAKAELFDSTPIRGALVTFDLGAGLRARVRLALSDAEATAAIRPAKLDAMRAALALVSDPPHVPDLDTRLADIVSAWNVFRHFYPYWTETRVDWDSRLRPQLELAYVATTREAQRDALKQLVADARDGHGRVVDSRDRAEPAWIPIRLRIIAGAVVVTASDSAADVPVGAIVSTINGIPALERVTAAMRLASGTTQWTQARALQEIITCSKGAVITLTIDSGSGLRQVSLPCVTARPPSEKRPAAVVELVPGQWYVDLTRARMEDISGALEQLARARGVVFDVRGYPTDAGAQILPYLIDAAETDRWMHMAKIVGPFGETAGWQSVGWDIKPRTPRLSGKIVFLTDERAISYAESVMGYVGDRKLGTVVGSTTAGTNGNVVRFPLPGGFAIAFTGMRVTRHDGNSPFHLVGVKPDIPVMPSVAGLREGRDEVLERGLAAIRGN